MKRPYAVLALLAISACTHPVILPQEDADAVTEWTLEADRLGHGGANWHTTAIMHQAMHDAANAASPHYARWASPSAGEPPGDGASVEAAIATAADTVLTALHPEGDDEIAAVYQRALSRLPHGPAVDRGIELGTVVGKAAVAGRSNDGFNSIRPFIAGSGIGQWRPTPPDFKTSNTTDAVPFLFPSREWPGARPPPVPFSPAADRDTVVVRDIGSVGSRTRTADQTASAKFWAYQSSQRGFMLLAVRLLYAHPRPGGLIEHARIMSQLASAMADSAILTWAEKERYASWRPITVIRGGFGVAPDPNWAPMIETPEHPEYPSGHASDCFTGAFVLDGVLGRRKIMPVVYIAPGEPAAQADAAPLAMTMGQEVQSGARPLERRIFNDLEAAADECANSRVWSGAHFPAAKEESHHLAEAIAERALASAQPLSNQGQR